jgi:hypothetical protein
MGKFSFLIIIFICLFTIYSYPPRYINSQFNKFFSSYLPILFVSPMITNETDFAFIRRSILNKPTIPEYQIASRIAKTINIESVEDVDNPLVKARIGKQTKFDTNVIIHYTHEKRFQTNKKDIHQLWNQTFQQTPVMNIRLIIGNRNSRNMTRELVHRRPQQ